MDVLTHIKEEHDKFKKLISDIKEEKGEKKKELFRELYVKIYGHHKAEEHEVFPLVKDNVSEEEKKNIVREMIEEHSLINYQFSVLEKTSVDNETWDAKFSVLKEILEHHMDEEEEDFIELGRKTLTRQLLEETLDPYEEYLDEAEKEKKKDLK
eukprot:Anaeramoba_flamelloidesa332877_45.p1 GENE.a332877_45~~a332877_45.p1  ORF type:complete len:154 (+),score=39.21 a332877_45:500-961(+)